MLRSSVEAVFLSKDILLRDLRQSLGIME
jgi:hypothetical protein